MPSPPWRRSFRLRSRSSSLVGLGAERARDGIGADQINPGGGGADIGPSVTEAHIPAMSLDVDGSKYFLIHHTPADTIDKIDPVEMAKCAAAVAVMAYVIADLPQRLGQ